MWSIKKRGDYMEAKIKSVLGYLIQFTEPTIDRILKYISELAAEVMQPEERPCCPRCGSAHVIKYGHKEKRARFLCHECNRTFSLTTNTVMEHSHYDRQTWAEFIRDTIHGVSLDKSAQRLGFSHQTAFNMRHKLLLALEQLAESEPVTLSGTCELDETFVLDSYKGKKLPETVGRKARKHGAKAQKRGISSEYICICAGIQRDGRAIAESVNRAKPTKEELGQIFGGRVADGSLVLTDGLLSYKSPENLSECTVLDVNREGRKGGCNLNTVNSFHSFIKEMYLGYRGVATKYINRYNALFAQAFRNQDSLYTRLISRIGSVGMTSFWHGVLDIPTLGLPLL